MKTATPAYVFLAGLALVALGLVAVPVTVAALGGRLPVSCPAMTFSYDPGYGVGPQAAVPSCSVIAQR